MPNNFQNTHEKQRTLFPYLNLWMSGKEERFQRKVIKLFEGAGVDRRYSIMDAEEVFLNTSFEEKNDIYSREVIQLGEKALLKSLKKQIFNPQILTILLRSVAQGL